MIRLGLGLIKAEVVYSMAEVPEVLGTGAGHRCWAQVHVSSAGLQWWGMREPVDVSVKLCPIASMLSSPMAVHPWGTRWGMVGA